MQVLLLNAEMWESVEVKAPNWRLAYNKKKDGSIGSLDSWLDVLGRCASVGERVPAWWKFKVWGTVSGRAMHGACLGHPALA